MKLSSLLTPGFFLKFSFYLKKTIDPMKKGCLRWQRFPYSENLYARHSISSSIIQQPCIILVICSLRTVMAWKNFYKKFLRLLKSVDT